jgi:tetratricopeptide (TPR) repeat protein/DNA-binding MarR family transcriptional regulator
MINRFSLPVEKKILIHLSPYTRFSDAWEVPREISQEGIGERFGMLLNNVSRAMTSLSVEGMVVDKLKHVKGMKRRRKAYFLTDKGTRVAEETRDSILNKRMTYLDSRSKAKTDSVEGLMEHLEKDLQLQADLLDVMEFMAVSDPFDTNGFRGFFEQRGERARFVAYTEKAPLLEDFVGREAELSSIKGILDGKGSVLLVVQGIAGIGKTSLGVKVLEAYRGRRHTFWHKIREFDTVRSVSLEVSQFMGLLGKRRLSTYARGKRALELGRLSDMLESELRGEDVLLVFDDFHNASEGLIELFSIFADIATRTDKLKILLLTRRTMSFYEIYDAGVSKLVREMSLDGLDPVSAVSFLSPMKLRKEKLDEIYELTKGSPLFLELIRSLGIKAGASNLRKFVEEAIIGNLSRYERRLLELMSVLRQPVPLDLLLSGSTEYADLSSLVKKSMVVEYPGEFSEVHDVIKEHVYRMLNADQRKGHHAEVADMYLKSSEVEEGELEEDDLINLRFEALHHLEKAEDWERALDHALRFAPWFVELNVRDIRDLLEVIPLESVPEDKIAVFHEVRGDAHKLNEDWQKALREYRKALAIGQKTGRKEDLAQLHSSIAQVQMKTELWTETLKSHKSALKLFEESRDKRGMARELIALGTTYRNMNDHQKALESYEKSLGLSEALGDKPGMAAVLNNMAILNESMGKWRKAKRLIERSLENLAETENEVERARVLFNLAGMLESRGQTSEALEALEESLTLFKGSRHEGSVSVLMRQGDIHFSSGNLPDALRCYKGARGLHALLRKSRGGPWARKRELAEGLEPAITRKLLDTLRGMEDWKRYASLLEEEIGRADDIKDEDFDVSLLVELGLALEKLEDFEGARKNLLTARKLLKARKETGGLVAVDLNLGRILRNMGETERSNEAFERALKLARKAEDKAGIEAAEAGLKEA